jgi:hypothetical protein
MMHGPINLRFRVLVFKSRKIILLAKKAEKDYSATVISGNGLDSTHLKQCYYFEDEY